jgi:hypothetical protein
MKNVKRAKMYLSAALVQIQTSTTRRNIMSAAFIDNIREAGSLEHSSKSEA